MAESKLKVVSFNCNGFKANHQYIVSLTQSFDVIFLCETWLLESEKQLLHNFKSDFSIYFTPGNKHDSGRPYGGNALFVRNSLVRRINLILQEDFATIVKVDTNSLSLLLTGVYLKSSNSENYKNLYQNQIDTISGTLSHFEECCEFVIIGDFQCCPSKPCTDRSGQPNSLSPILDTFMED